MNVLVQEESAHEHTPHIRSWVGRKYDAVQHDIAEQSRVGDAEKITSGLQFAHPRSCGRRHQPWRLAPPCILVVENLQAHKPCAAKEC
jgi:hypothetical protein